MRNTMVCPGRVREVTYLDFESVVLNSRRPVLLEFHTDTCFSAGIMDAVLERIARKYEGVLKVCVMDAGKEPETAEMYHVAVFPSYVLLYHGKVLAKIIGITNQEDMERMINRYGIDNVSRFQKSEEQC